jgi:hypothetical protein
MRPIGQEDILGHTMSLSHPPAMDLAQAGSTVESKIYDTLQWQVRVSWGGTREGACRLQVTF